MRHSKYLTGRGAYRGESGRCRTAERPTSAGTVCPAAHAGGSRFQAPGPPESVAGRDRAERAVNAARCGDARSGGTTAYVGDDSDWHRSVVGGLAGSGRGDADGEGGTVVFIAAEQDTLQTIDNTT